ncbi:hypothetical protein [Clostridium sp. C2-6-12]|uniref:hypothetical protein n=1 Tax=Clostridium sp. C2-6-12 TaxID=2698832 RepID=UPI001367B922|nr:hypothetical protein [Clostridium sp. C2-6-12]
MNNKRNRTMWGISLFIISIVTFINAFSSLIGIKLPYILIRCMGVIQIFALPVLVYSSVKILKNSNS